MALSDLERDEHGYLVDVNAWNADIAREMTAEEDIDLTDASFKILNFFA